MHHLADSDREEGEDWEETQIRSIHPAFSRVDEPAIPEITSRPGWTADWFSQPAKLVA